MCCGSDACNPSRAAAGRFAISTRRPASFNARRRSTQTANAKSASGWRAKLASNRSVRKYGKPTIAAASLSPTPCVATAASRRSKKPGTRAANCQRGWQGGAARRRPAAGSRSRPARAAYRTKSGPCAILPPATPIARASGAATSRGAWVACKSGCLRNDRFIQTLALSGSRFRCRRLPLLWSAPSPLQKLSSTSRAARFQRCRERCHRCWLG